MALDIFLTYRLTISILSIGILIASLENLKVWPVFQSKGILSWNVSKLGIKWFVSSRFSKLLDFLMQEKMFKWFIYIRVFSSILTFVFSILNIISPIPILFLFFSTMLVSLRSSYGLNGANQMHLVILLALLIGSFSGVGSHISLLCLWFIVGELLLSYFISGITKFGSPMWRKSLAIKAIFSTRCFGHAFLYRLFSTQEVLTVGLSWFVFCFEILFFTILFFSPQFAILFIIAGFLFHLSNAIFMGLNDFLFAFCAAYPALIYCVQLIHSS